jgi:hypothetical protein
MIFEIISSGLLWPYQLGGTFKICFLQSQFCNSIVLQLLIGYGVSLTIFPPTPAWYPAKILLNLPFLIQTDFSKNIHIGWSLHFFLQWSVGKLRNNLNSVVFLRWFVPADYPAPETSGTRWACCSPQGGCSDATRWSVGPEPGYFLSLSREQRPALDGRHPLRLPDRWVDRVSRLSLECLETLGGLICYYRGVWRCRAAGDSLQLGALHLKGLFTSPTSRKFDLFKACSTLIAYFFQSLVRQDIVFWQCDFVLGVLYLNSISTTMTMI